MSRTLLEISDDLRSLETMLEECDGDDEAQANAVAAFFEQLGRERDTKVDNYAALIVELKARAAARKAEGLRLLDRSKVDEERAKFLYERLRDFFAQHGIKTLETARYRLTHCKNGGKPPVVLSKNVPLTDYPGEFTHATLAPDMQAIREALEQGERLPFAHLSERGTLLRIN